MLCGRHCSFGLTRIDNDDLRGALITHHTLPHNRMRDAWVGSHKNKNIRLFKVLIRIWRRIKAKGLLISDHRGRHTLPRITITMHHPHSELCQCAEKSHLLSHDLAGTEKSHRGITVLRLDAFKLTNKRIHRLLP